MSAITDETPNAATSVLDFWFELDENDPSSLAEAGRRWFSSNASDDRAVESRFGALSASARRGELGSWKRTPRGRLALIVLLDQFSRSLYRGTADAFSADAQALELTQEGIAERADLELAALERVFFYMPLQHAESLDAQQLGVETFEALAKTDAPEPVRRMLEGFADYARLHRDIISRFGRFPHRNAVLGRVSGDAEREYLESGGPTFGQ